MSQAKTGKNRRSYRNIMINPRGKLRILFGIPVGGLVAIAGLLMVLKFVILTRLERITELAPELTSSIQDHASTFSTCMNIGILTLLCCVALIIFLGLFLGHRFYGPIVPITRVLKEMGEGNYSSRVRLRPGDELTEVMKAVNELAEKLENKNS